MEMRDVEKKFLETVKRYNLIEPGELVIAGVSGGPDSLVLLHLLTRLAGKLGCKVHAAHLNHSFRGKEAEEEASWVENTAQAWGIPCTVGKADVPALARARGLSPQDAGHLARKEFFLDLLDRIKAHKIALGHQSDDQAETLLMRFLTGAGPEGLRGILPRQGFFIRPLLFISRGEIETYCRKHGLDPRRDPSNEKDIYLRNKIRNQLLPWLVKNINPNLPDTLNRTAQVFWAEEDYLQEMAAQAAAKFLSWENEEVSLSLAGWNSLHPALQRRIIRLAYQHLVKKQGPSFRHVEEVRALGQEKQVGKMVRLPGKVTVEKTYDRLLFYTYRIPVDRGGIEKRMLNIPGATFIPETRQIIEASISDVPPPATGVNMVFMPWEPSLLLCARSRLEGDRFSPGKKGKKLKEYLIEKKIPRQLRDRILLVAHNQEVLWIPGLAVGGKLNRENPGGKYLVLKINVI